MRPPRVRLGGTRIASLGLLAAALVGLWKAMELESWGFDGPGPGFFPQLMAGICVAFALVVLAVPGQAGETEGGDTDDVEGTKESNRTFTVYLATFGVFALGAMYAGFVATTIAVTVIIMRFAERRSWLSSIVYGVACAAVGLVCFGWLLRVDLPEGPIERTFYTYVR